MNAPEHSPTSAQVYACTAKREAHYMTYSHEQEEQLTLYATRGPMRDIY